MVGRVCDRFLGQSTSDSRSRCRFGKFLSIQGALGELWASGWKGSSRPCVAVRRAAGAERGPQPRGARPARSRERPGRATPPPALPAGAPRAARTGEPGPGGRDATDPTRPAPIGRHAAPAVPVVPLRGRVTGARNFPHGAGPGRSRQQVRVTRRREGPGGARRG